MPEKLNTAVAVIGIDIGKHSFHWLVSISAVQIVLRQKWSRGQVEARFANFVALPRRSPPHLGSRSSVPSNRAGRNSPASAARRDQAP